MFQILVRCQLYIFSIVLTALWFILSFMLHLIPFKASLAGSGESKEKETLETI